MTTPTDDAARRAFWTTSMDEADEFMAQIAAYPVEECGEPMASLVEAADTAGVEVLFTDAPHLHGMPRQFYLREALIARFVAVAAEMNARGWVLKVEDAYRTVAMQQASGVSRSLLTTVLRLVQWECGMEQPPVELLCRRIGALVASSPKVGTHMSGSAMDVSVFQRDSGEEVDRGVTYVQISERTPMASPFVSETAQRNRREITALFARHGFVTYPYEFWHYNSGDAYEELLNGTGRPARYGAVHMNPDGTVTPIDNPCAPLNSTEVIRELMEQLLAEQREARASS